MAASPSRRRRYRQASRAERSRIRTRTEAPSTAHNCSAHGHPTSRWPILQSTLQACINPAGGDGLEPGQPFCTFRKCGATMRRTNGYNSAENRSGRTVPAWDPTVRCVFYWLIVGVFSVWRVMHLFAAEDGPWQLLARLRRRAGGRVLRRAAGFFYFLCLWIARQ